MSRAVVILVVICVISVNSQNCTQIRGNCSQCLVTDGCTYCASPSASGCFASSFGAYCGALSGTANDCSASGTSCVDYENCDTCQSAPGCSWCGTSTGYCFNDTGGAFLCQQLKGTWNSTCTSSTSSTGVTTTGSNQINQIYGKVDTNAHCEDFSASQCQGTVFYNVYVNSSYTQDQMNTEAAILNGFAGLPGVSDECRTVGTLLNCGSNFQQCATIDNTNIAVPIPVCRSLCQQVATACSNVFAAAGYTLDCEAIDPTTGTWKYPQEYTQYEYNGQIYEFMCNTMTPSDVGYYPNKLSNTNFITDQEGTLTSWESIGNDTLHNIFQDNVNGTNKMVIELSVTDNSPLGISQTVFLNRTTIFPIRIRGTSKAVNVSGDYGIYVDIFYTDGSNSSISAIFPTGSHDYTTAMTTFTPLKTIQKFIFLIKLTNGTAFFTNLNFQEKIPDSSSPYICYQPYGFDPEWQQHNTDPCRLTCPYEGLFDNHQVFLSTRPAYLTLSWISFVGNSFLIVTWLLFPEKRKYPERLVVYFSACVWLVSLNGILQTPFRWQDLACYDSFTILSIRNSFLCGLLGVLLQFGGAGAIGWWFCLVLSTWIMIRFSTSHKKYRHIERYFHIGVWSYASISTVIPLAAMEFDGGKIGSTGCWISEAYNSAFQLGCYYIPLGISIFIASILIIDTVRYIHAITASNKGVRSGGRKRSGERKFLLFGFIILIYVNVTFLFIYKFYTFSNEDNWVEGFKEELICRVNGGTEEECKVTRINAAIQLMNWVGIGVQGIIIFCFFGLNTKNFQLWKGFLTTKLKTVQTRVSRALTIGSSGASQTESELRSTVFQIM